MNEPVEDRKEDGNEIHSQSQSQMENKINDEEISENHDSNGIINTDDCINTSELHKDRPLTNRYILNPEFNNLMITKLDDKKEKEEEVEKPTEDDKDTSEIEHSSGFIPSELKGMEWPEGDISYVDKVVSGMDMSADPALADLGTVFLDKNSPKKNDTVWNKFKDNQFQPIIQNNEKLKNMPSSQSTVLDTFANKMGNNNNPSNKRLNRLSDGIIKSPFKIFDDTSIDKKPVSKSKSKLNIQNDAPNFMNESNELFQRIVTNSSSNGALNKGLSNIPILDMKTPIQSSNTNESDDDDDDDDDEFSDRENKNMTNTDDITSDAEEFTSIKSTTRKMVNMGNQLYKDIQTGILNKGLTIPNNENSQYDFTSADENDENDENKPIDDNKLLESYNIKTYEGINNSKPESIDQLRKRLNMEASKYNKDFNVGIPRLRSNLKLKTSKNIIKPVPVPGHNGLNFISGEEYKNKVFDRKLGKFVSKSQLVEDSSYTFDNNDGKGAYDYGFDTEIFGGEEDEDEGDESDDELSRVNETRNIFNDLSSSSEINNTIIKSDDGDKRSNGDDEDDDDDGNAFSITDKVLIDVITESYPIDDWDLVKELSISGAKLEQISHLNKMTPNLWYLDASDNLISQNFGIPSSVQFVNLSNNKFDSLSAKFSEGEFNYLQNLNLSSNEFKDLRCVRELKNLNCLDLSFNMIKGVEYLENFKMLHTLNLSNNKISGIIDFRKFKLWFLEDLILDNNEIEELINISELPKIGNLSANNNRIRRIVYDNDDGEDTPKHPNLRRLCLNNNNLSKLELGDYQSLREIQFDCNPKIEVIEGNFQDIVKLTSRFNPVNINEMVIDKCLTNGNISTLHLIGGRMPNNFNKIMMMNNRGLEFSNIQTLDISAMGLLRLPIKFSEMFPLLRDLNVNFNKLIDLKGIEGCEYLQQLKLLDNNIEKLEDISHYCNEKVKKRLKLLDVRVNPVTNGIYPYVFYDDDENGIEDTNNTNNKFQLHEMEDISAFCIEYARHHLPRELEQWQAKCHRMQQLNGSTAMIRWREQVEAEFPEMVMLDGLIM